ncbi:MAG: flagellar basal-body rod protein FlgF [Pontibacterium sp.]
MDRMVYIGMTGARENMLAQQAHANNLANATTTGFKSDMSQARAMQVFGEGHASRVYAMTERPATNLDSGTLIETARSLDVAIQGDGWMAVQAEDGTEAYTRMGELQVNSLGVLVTGSGLPVMGNGGVPVVLPPFEKIEIANDGTISIRPQGEAATELVVADQIKLVRPDTETFFKGSNGLMRTDNQVPLEPALDVELRSGYLESSNVNAVHELTSMITLHRQFEMNIKMMTTAQENSSAAAKILELS